MMEDFLDYLRYDPCTGEFIWKKRPSQRTKAGEKAGCVHSNNHGYVVIKRRGKGYLAHRIAWLLTYGEWPDGEIDHINGDRTDNRLENLRLASRSQNARNQTKYANNTSGLMGVHFKKATGRWGAKIQVDKKQKHLGYFNSKEEAYAAYCKAAEQYHGEYSAINRGK